jgi:multidrug efflux pump subunit AcrB
MQVYLGSAYVNDITRFGRNWQVNAQADSSYRVRPEDIGKLKVRNGEASVTYRAGATTGTKAKTTSSGTTKGTKSTPATTPKTSEPPTSTVKKGEAGSPDERLEMLEIQRLVEKQNQLFTLVSNLMKSMHDTSMVAIQNVR